MHINTLTYFLKSEKDNVSYECSLPILEKCTAIFRIFDTNRQYSHHQKKHGKCKPDTINRLKANNITTFFIGNLFTIGFISYQIIYKRYLMLKYDQCIRICVCYYYPYQNDLLCSYNQTIPQGDPYKIITSN